MFNERQTKVLADMQNSKTLLLVEGKKDRIALEKAGLGNVIEISGKRLEKVVDIIKEKQTAVAVLTDYDKEGIKQYKRLKRLLIADEIKVDDNIRRDFKMTFPVSKIEEFNSYFK